MGVVSTLHHACESCTFLGLKVAFRLTEVSLLSPKKCGPFSLAPFIFSSTTVAAFPALLVLLALLFQHLSGNNGMLKPSYIPE